MNNDKSKHLLLLDAARMEHLMQTAKELNPSFDSLYRGRSEEDLEAVAPYLFSFPGDDAFKNWIFEEGWGDSWGVILETSGSFEDAWKHFRKFLLVKTEEGEELYFRFYDPRVLKIFLPTCDAQQLKEFFGPIEKFITEGDTKEEAIVFMLKGGALQQSITSAASIFGMPSAAKEPAPAALKKKRNIIIDDTPADKKK